MDLIICFRFQLSKVSEVSGIETDGWFTSKLIAMKFISKCKDCKSDKFQVCTLPKTDLFLDSDKKVTFSRRFLYLHFSYF